MEYRQNGAMAGRRIVVGASGEGDCDDDWAHTVAQQRRDAGDEVVLLGGGLDVEQLGSAVIDEDAAGVVVVGTEVEADRLRVWLDQHWSAHVGVTAVAGDPDGDE